MMGECESMTNRLPSLSLATTKELNVPAHGSGRVAALLHSLLVQLSP
jgi:hypothetical protein